MINNGNRTEWSPVRSVIVRVTKEIKRSFDLFDHEYDNRRIGCYKLIVTMTKFVIF